MKKILKIGSRASKLALTQTGIIKKRLETECNIQCEILEITTSGDKDQKRKIQEIGGKGVFVKEIEEALLSGLIDLAVHSLKDMPARLPSGLKIGAFIPAENRRDVYITATGKTLESLSFGAKVGTSSPRRTGQLMLIRPDFNIAPIRGNIETRLKKLENGEYDAIVLAHAGLKRLGLEKKITGIFSEIIPAPGQGVLAIEVRENDQEITNLISKLDDKEQRRISEYEFKILEMLGATCHTPIGLNTHLDGAEFVTDIYLADEEFKTQLIEHGFRFRSAEAAVKVINEILPN